LNAAQAEKLAEDLSNLEKGIFGAILSSNTGQVLGSYIKPEYRSKFSANKEEWAGIGFKGALILGSAVAATRMLSDLQSVIFIRSELKGMLILIPDQNVIASIIFERSLNGSDLTTKVRKFLGME
jgi:hypothetical protein